MCRSEGSEVLGQPRGVAESSLADAEITRSVVQTERRHHHTKEDGPADRSLKHRVVVQVVLAKKLSYCVVGQRHKSTREISRRITRTEVTEVHHADQFAVAVERIARMEVAVEPLGRSIPDRYVTTAQPEREHLVVVELVSQFAETLFEGRRSPGKGDAAIGITGRVAGR